VALEWCARGKLYPRSQLQLSPACLRSRRRGQITALQRSSSTRHRRVRNPLPRRQHFKAPCEPSVHGIRAQWSLDFTSKQEAAAQHAGTHGRVRGKRVAAVEESGWGRKICPTGKFLQDEEGRQLGRRRLGGRGSGQRQGRRGGGARGDVAAAVNRSGFTAGTAGIIHDRAEGLNWRCLDLRHHPGWQDQRDEKEQRSQMLHGMQRLGVLRRTTGLGKIFLYTRRQRGGFSFSYFVPSRKGPGAFVIRERSARRVPGRPPTG
jgi:hypothetical protein